MQPHEQQIVRRLLRTEYEKLRGRNPAFSQRAFAKKIGVHSGTLSSFLQGRRKLTSRSANKILSRLKLEDNFQRWIADTLAEARPSGKISRTLLDLDRFEILSDPVHLNALNLLRTKGASQTIGWLARRLVRSEAEIEDVLARLARAGLVEKKLRRWVPSAQAIETPENFPHHAVRAFHHATLREAAERIEAVPVALRDFSSITIPADPAKIEEVRELIRNFRDQVSFLVGSEPGTEVYKLAVQYYPVCPPAEAP